MSGPRLSRQTELEIAAMAPAVRKSLLGIVLVLAIAVLLGVLVAVGLEFYLLSLSPRPVAVSSSGFAFSIRSATR